MKWYYYIILGSSIILGYYGTILYKAYKEIGLWDTVTIIGGLLGVTALLLLSVFLISKGISLRKEKNGRDNCTPHN